MHQNPLSKAIGIIGLGPLAKACGRTYQAVQKWERGGLPASELTGGTQYAAIIADITNNQVTVRELWDWSFPNRPREEAAA